MKTFARTTLAVIALTALGACAHDPGAYAYGGQDGRYQQPGATSRDGYNVAYGVVTAIEPARASGGSATGAGALLGGVIGAVIGRQVAGRGDARTAGTFAGAVAGALIGNHVEGRRSAEGMQARVSVQLDRGGVITLDGADINDLRVGERVRIENNRLYRIARGPAGLQYERS